MMRCYHRHDNDSGRCVTQIDNEKACQLGNLSTNFWGSQAEMLIKLWRLDGGLIAERKTTMKKVLFIAVLLFGMLAPTVLADGHADPEALTKKFMGILESQSYEYTWHYEPGVEPGFYEGAAPHGAILRTYHTYHCQ